jgi:hypothetical protein
VIVIVIAVAVAAVAIVVAPIASALGVAPFEAVRRSPNRAIVVDDVDPTFDVVVALDAWIDADDRRRDYHWR